MSTPERTLRIDNGVAITLDQTQLPHARVELVLRDAADCARAIGDMQVRGAPLIGAVGAVGLALALRDDPSDHALRAQHALLLSTRPTAVNLHWALERVRGAVASLEPAARAARAWQEAAAIAEEDVAINEAIGRHGAALLAPLAAPGRPLQILTHCNAGRLATVGLGTALAPIYRLHAAGVPLHIWVDETRPRNQGAALTAWELADAGVPHTVIADNAGGLLMRQRRIDAAIVGCDRVARNGDVANKVGTYLKALAAHHCDVPFLVACPSPTIDFALADGDAIPIEARSPREVTHVAGALDRHGIGALGRAADWAAATDRSSQVPRVVEVRVVPEGTDAFNPAFDVTPASLVTALVTERGSCAASANELQALFPERWPGRTSHRRDHEPN